MPRVNASRSNAPVVSRNSNNSNASSVQIWNENSQVRQVYNWTELLSDWNDSLTMPPYVLTVVENLRAASDPDNTYNPPLSHFLNYLNNEQDAIKWFLYECIAMRWMYGEVRLDYVRDLLTRVENLDSYFPDFVGSPGSRQTVREFVESSLSEREQDFVQLMPRLIPTNRSYSPPFSRSTGPNNSWRYYWAPDTLNGEDQQAAEDEESESSSDTSSSSDSSAEDKPEPKPFVLRILCADEDKRYQKADMDLIINIFPDSSSTFTYTFTEPTPKKNYVNYRTRSEGLTRAQVLQRLSVALRLMLVDEDKYLSVQVMSPFSPTVLIGTENLRAQERELIYETFEACCSSWPLEDE